MKQVLIRQGQAIVEETPAPQVAKGCVLVRVASSCISIGTEMSGLMMSGAPLWKRALKQPDNVRKVLQMVATNGISRTKSVVQGRLASGAATGYSAAGVVIAVGEGIDDIQLGDRVACAGAQCAHHAEIICVPRNLTVPIPDEVTHQQASCVTLGAIAMQGVRRANPTLGESFVVIGLGILGQLAVQMLKANGCYVIGVDLDSERVALAKTLGMDVGISPDEPDAAEQVYRLTDGIGADGVIITAATPSNEVVSNAFHMCRKKGRVVLVGDVGLDLKRADFYQKELDFFISTSYGPGRYDENYEEQGLDYPVAYVRWTENRNMSSFLLLIASGKVNVDALIAKNYPIDEATQAYAALKDGVEKPLMVLLDYPNQQQSIQHKVPNPNASASPHQGQVRLALIGAGGFAKGMHLPNLQKCEEEFKLRAVMSRSGHNAMGTAKQFHADYATTNYQEILDDKDIDAVLITTRHDTHAELVMRALHAGKHILVEKPLTLTQAELDSIKTFYNTSKSHQPILLTGFNRRFSPLVTPIKSKMADRTNPMMINYRMNAGYVPHAHWVHGDEGGGRNIGEACHIYDLFTYLTNSPVVSVKAQAIKPRTSHYRRNDNFVVQIQFQDGSVANLMYTALGNKHHPKEQMEVFVDGKVMVMNDYKSLNILGRKAHDIKTKQMEKGQLEEIKAFAKAIKHGGQWPIPLWQQFQAMEIAFEVEQQISEATVCVA